MSDKLIQELSRAAILEHIDQYRMDLLGFRDDTITYRETDIWPTPVVVSEDILIDFHNLPVSDWTRHIDDGLNILDRVMDYRVDRLMTHNEASGRYWENYWYSELPSMRELRDHMEELMEYVRSIIDRDTDPHTIVVEELIESLSHKIDEIEPLDQLVEILMNR